MGGWVDCAVSSRGPLLPNVAVPLLRYLAKVAREELFVFDDVRHALVQAELDVEEREARRHRPAQALARGVDKFDVLRPRLVRLQDRFLFGQPTDRTHVPPRQAIRTAGGPGTSTVRRPRTLKYSGASSASARGSGTHSTTVWRFLRCSMTVSMNSTPWSSRANMRIRHFLKLRISVQTSSSASSVELTCVHGTIRQWPSVSDPVAGSARYVLTPEHTMRCLASAGLSRQYVHAACCRSSRRCSVEAVTTHVWAK